MLKKDKLIGNKLYPNLIAYILGFGIPIYAVFNFDSFKEPIGIFFALVTLPLLGLVIYALRTYRYIDKDEENADYVTDESFIAQNMNAADSLFDNTKYLDKQFLYFALIMVFVFAVTSIYTKQFEVIVLICLLSITILFFIFGSFFYIARVEFRNIGIQIDTYSRAKFGIGRNIFIRYDQISFNNSFKNTLIFSMKDIQIFVNRKFTNYALQQRYWDNEMYVEVIMEIQKRLPKSQYNF